MGLFLYAHLNMLRGAEKVTVMLRDKASRSPNLIHRKLFSVHLTTISPIKMLWWWLTSLLNTTDATAVATVATIYLFEGGSVVN
jgi:hypothetical protein